MEKQQLYHLNAEALLSALRQRKPSRESFKLPFSISDAKEALISAVQVEVEYRKGRFVKSEALQQQAGQMAAWLTSDHAKSGMLLCGKCGNGKTTLVRAFQSLLNILNIRNDYYNTTWGIRIMEARDITHLCKTKYQEWQRLCHVQMLAIDDLGTEPTEVLDFGNVLNPVVDLLTKRYNEQLFTIITTNLTPAEIREKYGDRIADRFNEMMEKIIFKNDTYRV